MLGVRFLQRKSGRNPSIEIIIRGFDELSIINYKNIVNSFTASSDDLS